MIKRDPFAFMLVVALAFLCVLLLVGCGTYHTLEELEDEALQTGDWTMVEKREARQAGELAYEAASDFCAGLDGHYILYCDVRGPPMRTARDVRQSCGCIKRSALDRVLW